MVARQALAASLTGFVSRCRRSGGSYGSEVPLRPTPPTFGIGGGSAEHSLGPRQASTPALEIQAATAASGDLVLGSATATVVHQPQSSPQASPQASPQPSPQLQLRQEPPALASHPGRLSSDSGEPYIGGLVSSMSEMSDFGAESPTAEAQPVVAAPPAPWNASVPALPASSPLVQTSTSAVEAVQSFRMSPSDSDSDATPMVGLGGARQLGFDSPEPIQVQGGAENAILPPEQTRDAPARFVGDLLVGSASDDESDVTGRGSPAAEVVDRGDGPSGVQAFSALSDSEDGSADGSPPKFPQHRAPPPGFNGPRGGPPLPPPAASGGDDLLEESM
mmetsp:Transcript_73580/g.198278  ORF Transcript_73580/g.198278 Transcript_73580/m.198278 type:complete len:334 (+) Transcript_73580:548-1549(+)